MPGLLTHLITALIGFAAIIFIFKNWKYGIAFAIGQLIPDVIRFGVTGIFGKAYSFNEIVAHPLFWKLSFTHEIYFWSLIFAVGFVSIFLAHQFKKINKKTFWNWFCANLSFLIGVGIHLVLDFLIIEKSYWI